MDWHIRRRMRGYHEPRYQPPYGYSQDNQWPSDETGYESDPCAAYPGDGYNDGPSDRNQSGYPYRGPGNDDFDPWGDWHPR
jgi:hypothetical protein